MQRCGRSNDYAPRMHPNCNELKTYVAELTENPWAIGRPGGIRTPDPRFRKPLLYPSELQAHKPNSFFSNSLAYRRVSVPIRFGNLWEQNPLQLVDCVARSLRNHVRVEAERRRSGGLRPAVTQKFCVPPCSPKASARNGATMPATSNVTEEPAACETKKPRHTKLCHGYRLTPTAADPKVYTAVNERTARPTHW